MPDSGLQDTETEAMTGRRLPRRTIAFAAVGALAVICGIFVIPAVLQTRQSMLAKDQAIMTAKGHLRAIALALDVYAERHHDRFPPAAETFDALYREGLLETGMHVSPLENGDGVSYVFTGVRGRSMSADEVIAFEDPDHIPELVLVLFGDMKVRELSHAEFEVLIARLTEASSRP